MCFTNHALDQFLEDLLDIGIDSSAIVRLGAKSTVRTQPLSLFEQRSSYARSSSSWNALNSFENEARELKNTLGDSFTAYKKSATDAASVMDYLEFEEPEFWEAFTVPDGADGMTVVGKDGRAVGKYYLYEQWINDDSAGVFEGTLPEACQVSSRIGIARSRVFFDYSSLFGRGSPNRRVTYWA